MSKEMKSSSSKFAVPEFAVNLRHYRELREMTQQELAAAVGIQHPHYWKLEHGTIAPSFGLALVLSKALKINLEKFLEKRKIPLED